MNVKIIVKGKPIKLVFQGNCQYCDALLQVDAAEIENNIEFHKYSIPCPSCGGNALLYKKSLSEGAIA